MTIHVNLSRKLKGYIKPSYSAQKRGEQFTKMREEKKFKERFCSIRREGFLRVKSFLVFGIFSFLKEQRNFES